MSESLSRIKKYLEHSAYVYTDPETEEVYDSVNLEDTSRYVLYKTAKGTKFNMETIMWDVFSAIIKLQEDIEENRKKIDKLIATTETTSAEYKKEDKELTIRIKALEENLRCLRESLTYVPTDE